MIVDGVRYGSNLTSSHRPDGEVDMHAVTAIDPTGVAVRGIERSASNNVFFDQDTSCVLRAFVCVRNRVNQDIAVVPLAMPMKMWLWFS